MSFVPIDGLRLLAIETGLLLAFTVIAFVGLRLFRAQYFRASFLDWVLARTSRAVLLVIAVALVGVLRLASRLR